MTDVATCKSCGISLVENENWASNDKKHSKFFCKICVARQKKNFSVQKRFGITVDEYEAILAAHDGHCDICGTTDPGGRHKIFNLDHDHVTHSVRGVLCHHCNTGLGLFKDDINLLSKAVQYLHEHSKSQSS